MTNKFAIILPTIGRETLKDAIESVLAQTYQEWKLIVSYDNLSSFEDISSKYSDTRILHVAAPRDHLPDSGASARNYAIKFVPNDCNWICYIDDDDVWHSNRLSRFNAFIDSHESNPIDLFYSYGDLWKMKHISPRKSEKQLKLVGIVNNVTCGGMCHTVEVFQKTKGWNPKNLEDHDRELFNEMKQYGTHDVLESSTFDFIWR